jgi:hypothetical protein
MHIGLIDIDSHNFPNLCLMKLSASFKDQGHTTALLKPDDLLKGEPLFNRPDKYYGAVVFQENKDIAVQLAQIGVIVGGTGIMMDTVLLQETETMYPDYDLYGIKNTAYGFLTRGCPRHCPFCIVGDKEGLKSGKVADLSQFWKGQRYIKLLDPNLLACEQHEDLLKQLAASGAWVDFTQGLDARLLTDKNIDLISQLKIKMLHFAWDSPKDKTVKTALLKFKKRSGIHDFRKLKVYVLCNYWSNHEQDLYRVYWLRDNGYDPYVMIYDKRHAPQETRYLQRWVNNKRIFRQIIDFQDYDYKVG